MPIYMKLGNIKGNVTTKGHEEWIEVGSFLFAVMKAYGDTKREEEVTEWFGGSDARVLYHHAENKKYKVIYPDADIIFILDSDRAVEYIWVGFPTK